MHLLAMYLLFLPLLIPGRPRDDGDAPVVDYVTDDPSSLLAELLGKPPFDHPDIAHSILSCLP